jgi:hypothetical protein
VEQGVHALARQPPRHPLDLAENDGAVAVEEEERHQRKARARQGPSDVARGHRDTPAQPVQDPVPGHRGVGQHPLDPRGERRPDPRQVPEPARDRDRGRRGPRLNVGERLPDLRGERDGDEQGGPDDEDHHEQRHRGRGPAGAAAEAALDPAVERPSGDGEDGRPRDGNQKGPHHGQGQGEQQGEGAELHPTLSVRTISAGRFGHAGSVGAARLAARALQHAAILQRYSRYGSVVSRMRRK